jgi:hypothetical protein
MNSVADAEKIHASREALTVGGTTPRKERRGSATDWLNKYVYHRSPS